MSDLMTFPETWEEYERSYGFTDTDEVYTNGSRLIQSFRVKQWLDHMQTANAVEVVRCKDCQHRFVDGENVRFNCCELNHNKVQSDDWFCADGERRSE